MRKLLLIGIMAMFTITTACGVETISEAENEQDTEETSKEQANDNSVVQEETDKGNEAGKTSNSNNTSDSEKEKKPILFSSGSEAIDYLRKELDMENNEDIIFDDVGGITVFILKGQQHVRIALCLVSKAAVCSCNDILCIHALDKHIP